MKLNNFSFLFFAVIFLHLSCQKKTDDATFSVAVSGEVTNHGAQILLSKALYPNSEYNFSPTNEFFFINDANVYLWDEKKQLFELNFKGNGKYAYADSTWSAQADKAYKIVVNVPNYGQIESELVIFPEKIEIDSLIYSFQPYKGDVYNPTNAELLNIEALFKKDLKSKQHFIEMSFNALSANKETLAINLLRDDININEKKEIDCGLIPAYSKSYSSNDYLTLCFTDECLINDKLYYSLMESYRSVTSPILISTLKIQLYTVSESYHKLLINLRNQDRIDERFQEVPPSYTNILNGVGIFYARNQSNKTFTIKK